MRSKISVALAAILLLMALAAVHGKLFDPVQYDEDDISFTMGQAYRVLDGEFPFADYHPIFGPAQQYVTAAFLKCFGRTVFAARFCTLCFVLLSAALAYLVVRGLTPKFRLSIPAALLVSTAVVLVDGSELTPQGSYMLTGVICLCMFFVLNHSLDEGGKPFGSTTLAILAGVGTGFALGTKPNVGLPLAIGTVIGLLWRDLSKGQRFLSALLCALPLTMVTVIIPLASTIPYLAAAAILVHYSLQSTPGPSGSHSFLHKYRLKTVGLYLIGVIVTVVVAYHSLGRENGLPGFIDWLCRMSAHARAFDAYEEVAILWPGRSYPKALAVGFTAIGLLLLLRKQFKLDRLLSSAIVGFIIGFTALKLNRIGLDFVSVFRFIVLWAPATVLLVYSLLQRESDKNYQNTPSTFRVYEPLLPLCVALLSSACQAMRTTAVVVPTLLAALLLVSPLFKDSNVRRPSREFVALLAAIPVVIFIAFVISKYPPYNFLRSVGVTAFRILPTNESVFRWTYSTLKPHKAEEDMHKVFQEIHSYNVERGLPSEVVEALDLMEADGHGTEVFCIPFPLPVILRPKLMNVSKYDYWVSTHLKRTDVKRELSRLESSNCRWVFIRGWREFTFGPLEQVRRNFHIDKQLSAEARISKYFPDVLEYLARNRDWECVLSTDEVQLWHRNNEGGDKNR